MGTTRIVGVLVVAAQPAGPPAWMWPVIGMGGLAVIAVIVITLRALKRRTAGVSADSQTSAPVSDITPGIDSTFT